MIDTETLRNLSNWVLWIGLLFVAFGTSGVNYFQGKLEKQRELIAQQKATEADRQATDLKANIAQLVSDGKQLQVQLQPFLDLAKKRFPELSPDEALTKLREDLTALKGRTGAIEASLRPRSLSKADIEELAPRLRAVGGQRVRILRNNNDEAAKFSTDIKTLCERAGWTIENDSIAITSNEEGVGVFCSGPQPSAACGALVLALRSKGLSVDALRDDKLKLPEGTLLVRVGSKPK